jgi:hypothetical protein
MPLVAPVPVTDLGGRISTVRPEDFGVLPGRRRDLWVDPMAFYRQVIGYEPYEQQRTFHKNRARIKTVAGAKRIGKSLMAAREVEPIILSPETHGWFVGVTYKRGVKEFEYVWNDLVRGLKLGTHEKNFNVRGGYMNVRFCNGSVAEVRSAKDEADLEAEPLDWVVLCEPAQHKESTFELLRERVAERRGVMILPGTPPPSRHWLKKIFDRGLNPSWPDYWSIQIPATETPYPGLDEVAKLERELSPRRYRRDVLAEFVGTDDNVYPTFEYPRHVDDLDYSPDLPLFWAFDFGHGHPWVCLWVQVDLSVPRFYVLREYYQTQMGDRQNILAVKKAHKELGWKRTDFNSGDPRAPAAHRELENNGVAVQGAESLTEGSKDRGIEKVEQLLEDADDGRPGLIIDRSCENFIDEFSLYHRGPDGKVVNRDDDGCDAFRYGVMEVLPDRAEPSISWL